MSVKAEDRKLKTWFTKIVNGELKLPRFQRFQSWDRKKISGLLETVLQELPLGITLILEVGDKPKFIDRYLATAPKTNSRVYEHLLDGQQRLTAFWRMLYNNYEGETYFVYLSEYDNYYDEDKIAEDLTVYHQSRWERNKKRYPLWCDDPENSFKRGMIPTELFRPGDIKDEITDWVNSALEHEKPKRDDPEFPELIEEHLNKKKEVENKISEYREIIKHYNLPYLSLPATTRKDVALQVFINMNTNSKPLSPYDIIVAEVESVKERSLHDLQSDLDARYPKIKQYYKLPELILYTSALLQDKLPNRRGALDMDKEVMVEKWGLMEDGLARMAEFMESQRIYDRRRLPTNAVLSVIAALYRDIPKSGDELGKAEILLKKYLWSSFFTDRYENSAATHAYYDFMNMKRVFNSELKESGEKYTEKDIPVLDSDKHPLAEVEELKSAGWPKNENIRGRAILAVASYLGANDFADGTQLNRNNLDKREYHHLYPKALLQEVEIEPNLAVNCALVSQTTNRKIGRKDPLTYLKERYEWADESIVDHRLKSHLIPKKTLANGGYEGLNEEQKEIKIKSDFKDFKIQRAAMMRKAAEILTAGETLTYEKLANASIERVKKNGY